MNISLRSFDIKSLVIGFLLAAVAFLIFSGLPRPARADDTDYSISATAEGVYIMNNGYVVFRQKSDCLKAGGCSYFQAPK